jgi:hypothetical protein
VSFRHRKHRYFLNWINFGTLEVLGEEKRLFFCVICAGPAEPHPQINQDTTILLREGGLYER